MHFLCRSLCLTCAGLPVSMRTYRTGRKQDQFCHLKGGRGWASFAFCLIHKNARRASRMRSAWIFGGLGIVWWSHPALWPEEVYHQRRQPSSSVPRAWLLFAGLVPFFVSLGLCRWSGLVSRNEVPPKAGALPDWFPRPLQGFLMLWAYSVPLPGSSLFSAAELIGGGS